MNIGQESVSMQFFIDLANISFVLSKIEIAILHCGLTHQAELIVKRLSSHALANALLDSPSTGLKRILRAELRSVVSVVSTRVWWGDRVRIGATHGVTLYIFTKSDSNNLFE
jgi:hypothetical protein